MEWRDETELFDLMERELYSAVIGDILDQMGFRHQILRADIKPVYFDAVVAGRAMTVLNADFYEALEPLLDKTLSALDDLKPNEVWVMATTSHRYALWGELMSTAARARGCRGAIMDGYTRDTKGIIALRFPVFAIGSWAKDIIGRGDVVDWRCPIECGGVRIEPGDVIFGDWDGIVVIPREVEEEVITKALEKARAEKTVQKVLAEGMPAKEAFRRYGVL
jgi:regulator of RNase E activity RraA